MMHAYDEQYLDDAMQNMGEAFDYAINCCGMEPNVFMDMFVAGGLAKQFGAGVPGYVAGMSGTELVWEVTKRAGKEEVLPVAQIDYEYSREYWAGWILAYYQWYSGRSFKDIKKKISMKEILSLYSTLHEASEEKCVEILDAKICNADIQTALQQVRKAGGYSQRELAKKSGVALRMIQQYEQRVKDINKASGITLLALAKTLGCQMEDLLEYNKVEVDEEEKC